MKSGIDPDILRWVVGNDPDFLREVLEDFVRHAQSEITSIHAAFVSQDGEQMKIPTHRLKGSASHQLMPRLGRLMQDIKTSANVLLGLLPVPCA